MRYLIVLKSAQAPVPPPPGLMEAIMQLGELLHDRQPNAQPPLTAGDRALPLGKELEHFRQPLGRDRK